MQKSAANIESNPVSDPDIKIHPQEGNLWKVRISFPTADSSENEMLTRMRTAKRMISEQYGTPIEILELREILDKSQNDGGLAVDIAIGRMDVGQGRPEIHLQHTESPSGLVFEDMIALVDIYYLDESDQKITVDRVMTELVAKEVDLNMVNIEEVQKAVDKVHLYKNSIEGLEVAHGELPDQGHDAKLEYAFFCELDEAPNIAEYRSGRKVRKKNVLAEKTPPEDGKSPGRNVRGEVIPPLKGLDFQLIAGEGTRSLSGGTTIIAERSGLAVMRRSMRRAKTPAGIKFVTSKIEVCVKQLITLDGEDIGDLVLDDSIEIKGTLKEGASISTSGEVLVSGDIKSGSRVNAGADITIYGKVDGAQIFSDSSVFTTAGAKDASITAGADVNVHGLLENSNVSGRKIKLDHVKGSRVEAGYKVIIKQSSDSDAGGRTTIKLGREELYERQLEANREVAEEMTNHLDHIQRLFGQEIMTQLGSSNTRTLLFEFLRNLRSRGVVNISNDLIQSYIKLLEAVKPIKGVITEIAEVISDLELRADEEKTRKPIAVIAEKVMNPVVVTINDKTTVVGHSKNGSAVTLSPDGNICTYSLAAPSTSKGINSFKKPPEDKKINKKKRNNSK